MLSQFVRLPEAPVEIRNPFLVLATLLFVLAVIFWLERRSPFTRIFRLIPALVFCYFVPTALSTAGIIPRQSPLFAWVKDLLLPASLVLLTISLDLPALLRLGPRLLGVFLGSTLGVAIGGPIALAIWKNWLPPDAWRAMSYLAGSWIGGAANAVALKESFGATDQSVSPLIVVDVVIAYSWMAMLLFLAARHERLDRWLRADCKALEVLTHHIGPGKAKASEQLGGRDMVILFSIGIGLALLAKGTAQLLVSWGPFSVWKSIFSEEAMKLIIATTAGVVLSMTRARRLESVGASRVGMVMLYLLVACIGAGADFSDLRRGGGYFLLGATWMLIHIIVLFAVGIGLRAPFFFLAVSSQSNIGGPVSAPVVAAAFSSSLAPVGVLLAICGYVLGTYVGWLSTMLCRAVGNM